MCIILDLFIRIDRGLGPAPRHELLHNIDPFIVAPLTYDDTTADATNGWTVELDIILSTLPHFDRFNTDIQAALRVGDWKIQTGPGSMQLINTCTMICLLLQ